MNLNLNKLIDALIIVESNGDEKAVGDNGHAIGILQLHKEYVDDVNRIYSTNYRWPEDAISKQRSGGICRYYLFHYGRHYEATTGNKVTYEILAKIHNGGPNGWMKLSTQKYWEKVERVMKSLENNEI